MTRQEPSHGYWAAANGWMFSLAGWLLVILFELLSKESLWQKIAISIICGAVVILSIVCFFVFRSIAMEKDKEKENETV